MVPSNETVTRGESGSCRRALSTAMNVVEFCTGTYVWALGDDITQI